MTKIVLVNLWRKSPYPLLGLGYLASYLQKYGDYSDIQIIECEAKDAINNIKLAKPDILGFTSCTPNYHSINAIAGELKKELDVPIILGGPHITPIPQTLSTNFDIGVIGEGEQTFLELMELFREKGEFNDENLTKIDGICHHHNGKVNITNPRKLITDLDTIPFPSRELFDMDYYLKPKDILCNQKNERGLSLLSSRGCPYRCIYCQATAHWGKIRLNSSKYISEEIKLIYDKYKVESIAIVDDLFIVNPTRIEEIINNLKECGILGEIKFLVDGRANMMTAEVLSLLKKLNVEQISIGFETGSDRMLRYLKKNSVTMKQNISCMGDIAKWGFNIYGQFMIGSPTETKAEMYETLNLMKDERITTAHVAITTPLPGTELWDYCINEKIIDPENIDWNKFCLEETTEGLDNNMYINEIVPFEDFKTIYKKLKDESLMKEMKKMKSPFLNMNMIKKAIKKPGKALRLMPRIIGSSIHNKFFQYAAKEEHVNNNFGRS